MKDHDHPEYPLEQRKLEETEALIALEIEEISTSPTSGGNELADQSISFEYFRYRLALEEAQGKPYFGRVDFEEDGVVTTAYIGRHKLDLNDMQVYVYSWQSTAGKLFYQGSAEHQIISTSKGKKQIRLLLQRELGIENSELRNIFDKVDRRQGDQVLVAASAHQAFLLGKLYSRGDKRLKDIVETIQRDQDIVIRAPAERPLIINGVAGSGKTSIAYHRLSYLLAPENELNLQLHQARTMILGPNPYFLKYAADVLPGLGMDKIIHTTYNKWALTASGLIFTTTKAPYTVTDRTLELILKLRKTEAERSLQVELSKLKGSLKFARLLDRYVKHRRNQINVPPQGLRYQDVGIENLKLHLTKENFTEEHQRVLNQRGTLQRQRDILLERLLQRLSMQAWDQLGRVYGSYKRQVEAILRESLAEDLNKIWSAVALQDDYYALLENRPLLQILGKELLTESEIQLLTLSERPTRGKVDAQDLPGLHYLATLLEGVKATYDHIVVDEGQDLSPLQYRLIRMHGKNDSITILGDVAQGIHRYRGVASWSEVAAIFDIEPNNIINIAQSYRATEDITVFTNHVLHTIAKEALPATPIHRRGDKPRILRSKNFRSMMQKVASDIRSLQASDYTNIAVITRSDDVTKQAAKELKQEGIEFTTLTSSSINVEQHDVTVLSAALAKGVEYEAVLVVDASAQQYNSEGYLDGQLLYVALSRALHHLSVYYRGDISPFLQDLVEEYEVDSAISLLQLNRQESGFRSRAERFPGKQDPVPFSKFSKTSTPPTPGSAAEAFQQSSFDTRDGSKKFSHMFRDQGRFGSFPLHDDHDEDSSPD